MAEQKPVGYRPQTQFKVVVPFEQHKAVDLPEEAREADALRFAEDEAQRKSIQRDAEWRKLNNTLAVLQRMADDRPETEEETPC